MHYYIIGKEDVNYVNKQGNQVKGVKLYVSYVKSKVKGYACETLFVSETKLKASNIQDIDINTAINVYYNRFGSVECIEIAEDAE